MIIVAPAAMEPATGILTSVATAAFRFSRKVAGTAVRSVYICHSVYCIMLYRFALGVTALHVQ